MRAILRGKRVIWTLSLSALTLVFMVLVAKLLLGMSLMSWLLLFLQFAQSNDWSDIWHFVEKRETRQPPALLQNQTLLHFIKLMGHMYPCYNWSFCVLFFSPLVADEHFWCNMPKKCAFEIGQRTRPARMHVLCRGDCEVLGSKHWHINWDTLGYIRVQWDILGYVGLSWNGNPIHNCWS